MSCASQPLLVNHFQYCDLAEDATCAFLEQRRNSVTEVTVVLSLNLVRMEWTVAGTWAPGLQIRNYGQLTLFKAGSRLKTHFICSFVHIM